MWAVGGGDSIGHGEIVEPHNNEVHEMDQHDRGKSFVWEGTKDPACALLDKLNFTFNLSNMLSRHRCIHIDFRYVVSDLVKFIIHHNCLHTKAGPSINPKYSLE